VNGCFRVGKHDLSEADLNAVKHHLPREIKRRHVTFVEEVRLATSRSLSGDPVVIYHAGTAVLLFHTRQFDPLRVVKEWECTSCTGLRDGLLRG
jgi:hypothetical protein